MKELVAIQNELKCPKSRKNKFGDYNYRNCDDIYEAVKPVLLKHGCSLSVSDDIRIVADRVYVVATATLRNGAGEAIDCTGYAREQLTKKGMDEAQITGAASSYARKYALNGLFMLDDNQDTDSGKTEDKPSDTITEAQEIQLRDLLSMGKAYTEKTFLGEAKVSRLSDLKAEKFVGAWKHIQAKIATEAA
jgi:hypothetical protein